MRAVHLAIAVMRIQIMRAVKVSRTTVLAIMRVQRVFGHLMADHLTQGQWVLDQRVADQRVLFQPIRLHQHVARVGSRRHLAVNPAIGITAATGNHSLDKVSGM